MGKVKLKHDDEAKRPKRRHAAGAETPGSVAPVGEAPPHTVWQREIEALSALEFSNMRGALEALIERVMTRMGTRSPEEREFLMVLFESDELLCESLRSALKIPASE